MESDPPASSVPPRTARDMLARARAFLERKGHLEARLEAELLVAHALGLDRLRLFLELERPLVASEVERGRELLMRRARGEPTAYLIGKREFYGRSFRVGAGVLVPRPETELLVDLARACLARTSAPRIAELGTGSGAIAITLALELAGARVLASDISSVALGYARENARELGARVTFVEGDACGPLAPSAPFDLLVSNPPYVASDQAARLAPEIRLHEPALALFAPPGDPDHWARRLLEAAPSLLAPGGTLLVELGFDQAARVEALAAERGFVARIERDLAGLPRVLAARAATS